LFAGTITSSFISFANPLIFNAYTSQLTGTIPSGIGSIVSREQFSVGHKLFDWKYSIIRHNACDNNNIIEG
jgi:hypothetical protein